MIYNNIGTAPAACNMWFESFQRRLEYFSLNRLNYNGEEVDPNWCRQMRIDAIATDLKHELYSIFKFFIPDLSAISKVKLKKFKSIGFDY